MTTKEEIISIIYKCIDGINQMNGINVIKALKTKLFGAESDLDSLGLVNLIVTIELSINNELGATISIADDRAMSQHRSPFRSVDALADYIMVLLNETRKEQNI
jgi:acyl carrier protein